MRITRRRPTVEWTQVPNVVARDHRLSWRARGLLLELLSYPPGWEVTIDDLVKQAARHSGGATEGRDAMRRAARELKDIGYLVARKYQDERGRWHTDLELTDAPMWALVNAQLELPDSAEGDRRRDSSRRPDVGEGDLSAGGTDDGKPAVGSPVVGGSGATPKNDPKNHPDPEEPEASHAEETPAPAAEVSGGPVPVNVLAQAAAIADRLDLARLDAQPKQRIQITQAIGAALMRPDADPATIERYAAAKVAEGRTVKYVLGAFTPERLTTGLPAYRSASGPAPQTSVPPRCDDPRHDRNVPADRNLYDPTDPDMPGVPCPRCHPAATVRRDTPAPSLTT